MSLSYREKYLTKTFNQLQEKLNNTYEHIFDGEFKEAKKLINSISYDLKQIKKQMEQ